MNRSECEEPSRCEISVKDATKDAIPKQGNIQGPPVDKVLSFIVKSSKNAACLLNDTNLLQFFSGDRQNAEEWFQANANIFRLSRIDDSGQVTVHVCISDIKVCTFNWKNIGCTNSQCQSFHICKKFLVGVVHSTELCVSCKSNHPIHKLREKYPTYFEKLSDYDLLILLRYRLPYICMDYSNQCCKVGPSYCSYLHICHQYMLGKCKRQEGVCMYQHQKAFEGEQARRIMKEFRITLKEFMYSILLPKRETDEKPACQIVIDNAASTTSRDEIGKAPCVDSVFLFIVKSSKCASCPLNDTNLLKFFNGDIENAYQWFITNNTTFRLSRNESGHVTVHACVIDIKPCISYWSSSCKNQQCEYFHICRRLLSGVSHSLVSCEANHGIRKPNKFEKLSDEEFLMLLRNRLPNICMDYLDQCCNLGDKYCSRLHICYDYILNRCMKQAGICQYKHQSGLEGEQAVRLIKDFHLSASELKVAILLPEREQHVGVTRSEDVEEFNFLKEAAICHHYLADQCDADIQCKLFHPKNKLPYVWQYKKNIGDAWIPLPPDENKAIENEFCDPSKDSGIAGSYVVLFNYNATLKNFTGTCSSEPVFVRRLSTKSSGNTSGKEFGMTEWKWYWFKSDSRWEEYSEDVCSRDIENCFLGVDAKCMNFKTGKFPYTLSFMNMVQQNMDNRYNTKRDVRRRPVFQGSAPLISVGTTYPDHWPQNCLGVQRIKVPPMVHNSLKEQFLKSIGTGFTVMNIEEICNMGFFDKYEANKRNLIKKLGEKNIDERFLYHGTEPGIVSAICAQNFDWRLSGKNATAYGQGSYFARDASYSHKYAAKDKSSTRYMFVASVLVGRYTQGSSSMKRPPLIPSSDHELFDSCVNNMINPSIFVIFERDQCYPRYLISYI